MEKDRKITERQRNKQREIRLTKRRDAYKK